MRQYNIPILFIFFNREDIALKTFERIRSARPSRLYLSQDGPRQERGDEEKERVRRIREKIISLIDWECDIHKRFMDKNLGCAMGVKTAIDWMFETESCGIILHGTCVTKIQGRPAHRHGGRDKPHREIQREDIIPLLTLQKLLGMGYMVKGMEEHGYGYDMAGGRQALCHEQQRIQRAA